MEIDFFGIRIGKEENPTGTKKTTEYTLTRKELLEKLGFKPEKVTSVQYSHERNELIVKQKEE